MDRSIVYMCVLLAVVTVVAAKSKQAGGKNRNKNCGEWTFGECVPKRGSCGPGKKHGTRTGETCRATERQFRCVVPCAGGERTGPADLAAVTRGRDGRRKNKPVACRYTRGTWSECDAAKSEKTRTLTLKKGDETCEKTKIETKKCKSQESCKYMRGTWSECDATTKQRTRTLTLKRGNKTVCEASKTESKPCKAGNGCKYGHSVNSTWTQCQHGVMNLTLVLRKGDSALCEPTQVRSKRCSSRLRREVKSGRCRYNRTQWGECDSVKNTRTRVNTLKKGGSDCPPTQTQSRKCKKGNTACRYEKGEWSECDASTDMRHRDDTLKETSDSTCEPTRTVERKCKNGRAKNRERCQFESWGAYGECINGVRTRMRAVVSGGEKCHRRAVKTKPCSN